MARTQLNLNSLLFLPDFPLLNIAGANVRDKLPFLVGCVDSAQHRAERFLAFFICPGSSYLSCDPGHFFSLSHKGVLFLFLFSGL